MRRWAGSLFSCSGTECAAEAGTSTGGRRYPRDSSDSASLWRTGRAPTGAAEVPNDRRTEHSWDRVPGAAERHNGNLAQTRTRCDGRQIADLSWPVISVTVSLETNLGLFRPDRWAHRQIGRAAGVVDGSEARRGRREAGRTDGRDGQLVLVRSPPEQLSSRSKLLRSQIHGRGGTWPRAGHGLAPVLSASRRNRLEKKDRARHASSPDARAVSAAAEVAEGAGQKQTSGHDQGLGWARPAGQQPGSRYLVLVCSETTAAYNLEAVGVASRQTWRTCEGTGREGTLFGSLWKAQRMYEPVQYEYCTLHEQPCFAVFGPLSSWARWLGAPPPVWGTVLVLVPAGLDAVVGARSYLTWLAPASPSSVCPSPPAPGGPREQRACAQQSRAQVAEEPAPTPTRGPLLTASSHGATVGEPSTPQSGPVIRVHGHGASSPLTVPETRRQLSSCLTDCGCGKDGDGHAAACTGSPAQHPPALAASTSGHEGLARQRRCLRPSRRPIPVLHERGARRVVRLAGQTRWRNRGYIEGHKSGAVHRRASPCIATHRQPFS
ncbi:hypothetical protein ACCO45_002323 [Purpureocillium lilacinum]|uniref:Uncharacterized protein n=1 Tax=Purpureocillium lilacinum TaxID=33203 RepID=A0ACC4EAW8_PURLI